MKVNEFNNIIAPLRTKQEKSKESTKQTNGHIFFIYEGKGKGVRGKKYHSVVIASKDLWVKIKNEQDTGGINNPIYDRNQETWDMLAKTIQKYDLEPLGPKYLNNKSNENRLGLLVYNGELTTNELIECLKQDGFEYDEDLSDKYTPLYNVSEMTMKEWAAVVRKTKEPKVTEMPSKDKLKEYLFHIRTYSFDNETMIRVLFCPKEHWEKKRSLADTLYDEDRDILDPIIEKYGLEEEGDCDFNYYGELNIKDLTESFIKDGLSY